MYIIIHSLSSDAHSPRARVCCRAFTRTSRARTRRISCAPVHFQTGLMYPWDTFFRVPDVPVDGGRTIYDLA